MSTAATQETASALPRINDTAPDFEAKTTQGPLKLSDFKGKWVVLFSHPADFTPVCTTEFVEFARRRDGYRARRLRHRPQPEGARAHLLPDEPWAQHRRGGARPRRASDRRRQRLRHARQRAEG